MIKIFCRFFYFILNKKTKEKYTKNMKKLFCFYLLFLFCFIFCACSTNKQSASADNLDKYVASEIEKNYDTSSLDDETLKALSVIVRTKAKDENVNTKKEYIISNKHILDIVNQTSGLVLKNYEEPELTENQKSKDWCVSIKKYDLLKYLSENNISVSSISSIEPIFSDDKVLTGFIVGGKTISFEDISNKFNIPSNNINEISNNLTEIKILGTTTNQEFDIEKASQLSKNGLDFQGIINHFYGNFVTI